MTGPFNFDGFKVLEQLDERQERHVRDFNVIAHSRTGRDIGSMPLMRVIRWCVRNGEYQIMPISQGTRQDAILIQSRGATNESECTTCRQGQGPFVECVTATSPRGETIGFGSCANCLWNARRCPLRDQPPIHPRSELARSTPNSVAGSVRGRSRSPAAEPAPPHRRSANASQPSGSQSSVLRDYLRSLPMQDAPRLRDALTELDRIRAAISRRLSELDGDDAEKWDQYISDVIMAQRDEGGREGE